LIKLADWMRATSISLKLKKNNYNRAISLLKKAVSQQESIYPMAAAALGLIIKFQSSQML